jgi:hypothetical protein
MLLVAVFAAPAEFTRCAGGGGSLLPPLPGQVLRDPLELLPDPLGFRLSAVVEGHRVKLTWAEPTHDPAAKVASYRVLRARTGTEPLVWEQSGVLKTRALVDTVPLGDYDYKVECALENTIEPISSGSVFVSVTDLNPCVLGLLSVSTGIGSSSPAWLTEEAGPPGLSRHVEVLEFEWNSVSPASPPTPGAISSNGFVVTKRIDASSLRLAAALLGRRTCLVEIMFYDASGPVGQMLYEVHATSAQITSIVTELMDIPGEGRQLVERITFDKVTNFILSTPWGELNLHDID